MPTRSWTPSSGGSAPRGLPWGIVTGIAADLSNGELCLLVVCVLLLDLVV